MDGRAAGAPAVGRVAGGATGAGVGARPGGGDGAGGVPGARADTAKSWLTRIATGCQTSKTTSSNSVPHSIRGRRADASRDRGGDVRGVRIRRGQGLRMPRLRRDDEPRLWTSIWPPSASTRSRRPMSRTPWRSRLHQFRRLESSESPDGICHYYTSNNKIILKDGTQIDPPYDHDEDGESEDWCIYCGEPEERK